MPANKTFKNIFKTQLIQITKSQAIFPIEGKKNKTNAFCFCQCVVFERGRGARSRQGCEAGRPLWRPQPTLLNEDSRRPNL
jgi:hypothetical protein